MRNSDERDFQRDYAAFVQDFAGFVERYSRARQQSLEETARECFLCGATLRNLTKGKTQNPQGYTLWKIRRFLAGKRSRSILD
jgi:hypothetical protein